MAKDKEIAFLVDGSSRKYNTCCNQIFEVILAVLEYNNSLYTYQEKRNSRD